MKPKIRSELSRRQVLSERSSKVLLRDSYLRLSHLKNSNEEQGVNNFPFLKMPVSTRYENGSDWALLKRLRVGVWRMKLTTLWKLFYAESDS
jgi:hypothetical protein